MSLPNAPTRPCTVTLDSDSMGPLVTPEDFESWVDFVTRRATGAPRLYAAHRQARFRANARWRGRFEPRWRDGSARASASHLPLASMVPRRPITRNASA